MAVSNQPEHGIYIRDMEYMTPAQTVFRRNGEVPQPNNSLQPDGGLATFNEFPSVPRIDAGSDTIATRAQSKPVWVYTPTGGTETRSGTAGIYGNPGGRPTTGASLLGNVPGFEYFQVPGVAAGTRFDQFPGSPAITERATIVFKGNYTAEGAARTGVFYRDILANRGVAPVELIASYQDGIPGFTGYKFGSTAPPSAAGKSAVFAGFDNEEFPNAGGIFRARLGNKPIKLEKVVAIGDPVPGVLGEKFNHFSEAVSLSSNGRHVLFWGAWGTATHPVDRICPVDGNAAVIAACISDTVQVPDNQGFFVKDVQLGTTVAVAKTGDQFHDFVYWNFSGRPPGTGHGEEGDDGEETYEPPRWRSATFGAVSATGVPSISAFKARTADEKDGIYVRKVQPSKIGEIVKLLETGMPGSAVDPDAAGTTIISLGVERDGFRGQWLAVTVGMVPATAEEGWAGVYTARFVGLE